jgi:hypothetical protein
MEKGVVVVRGGEEGEGLLKVFPGGKKRTGGKGISRGGGVFGGFDEVEVATSEGGEVGLGESRQGSEEGSGIASVDSAGREVEVEEL